MTGIGLRSVCAHYQGDANPPVCLRTDAPATLAEFHSRAAVFVRCSVSWQAGLTRTALRAAVSGNARIEIVGKSEPCMSMITKLPVTSLSRC